MQIQRYDIHMCRLDEGTYSGVVTRNMFPLAEECCRVTKSSDQTIAACMQLIMEDVLVESVKKFSVEVIWTQYLH